jgi:alpha-tubulin suppressor-like RCC1 family protein
MSTLTNPWWRVAATAAAGVLSLPAWAVPAAAAPSGSVVDDALRLRAALTEVVRGVPRGAATGVDDGYPGGFYVATGNGASCSAAMLKTYCWGANDAGQLGDGTTDDATEPVEVDLPRAVQANMVGAVTSGRAHSCALSWFDDTEDGGDLYCWGDNTEGQIGDGSTTARPEPVEAAENVRQVAAGADHTCAITEDADVQCWGRNDQGQLGSGATGPSVSTPQAVPGLSDVIDLAAGGDTTCALDEDGAAWCWGSDGAGQVGDGGGAAGSPVTSPTAVVMTDVDGEFVQIEVGDRHACAVTREDTAWCWGDDASGQLGNGSSAGDPSQPVEVTTGEDFVSVSAGGDSTCAVANSGSIHCWGSNAQGQLGIGDRVDSAVPAEVDQGDVPSVPFLGFSNNTVAATADGGGLLLQVSVGDAHACALDLQGNTFCWGDNSRGQIGNGTTADALTPVPTSLMPGPATGVRVTPGDRELTVAWSPPADPGTSDLLGFFSVAVGDGGFGDGFCKGGNACVIGDLNNGAEYQVVVVTQTEGGMSLSSAVPGTPVARASAAPVPGGGGGGQLPITGAAVSLIIAAGGALVAGGLLCLRLVRRRGA